MRPRGRGRLSPCHYFPQIYLRSRWFESDTDQGVHWLTGLKRPSDAWPSLHLLPDSPSIQFPDRNVSCLAGFSDKALQTVRFLEEDKGTLLREIESIEL